MTTFQNTHEDTNYFSELDDFIVYTVPRPDLSSSCAPSFQTFIKGHSRAAHLGFQGQIVMSPPSSMDDSCPAPMEDQKGIACQNLTFYRHKDGGAVELDNWGDGGRALIYVLSLIKQELEGVSGALDGHHVEVWAPLSLMATLTPEQHYWLALLLSPQGISPYPVLKDVAVTSKSGENAATTNEAHLLLSFEPTPPHGDTLNSSFEQVQRELNNRLASYT